MKRDHRELVSTKQRTRHAFVVILSSPTTCSSSSVYKFIQIEIPSIPHHFSTVPEMLRHATSENWQQQQQNLWFYGLPLGKNCIGPAAGRGTTDRFTVAEGDSVGVVSEDTLHKDEETSNGMKKRKTTIKGGSTATGEAKKMKKLDPDEETELEAPKLENSNKNRKEKEAHSKVSEPAAQKTDYIHVRARRGQATDSHSLAERVRREKISERMKFLQDLVPGCNHITGKASVLDEIINYVQSLQKQVEFLSMKLAAVDPLIDCNIQSFMGKKINVCPSTSISREMSTELLNPSFPLFNPWQPAIPSHCELGATVNLPELDVLHKTISTPVSVSDALLSSEPCFDVLNYFQHLK